MVTDDSLSPLMSMVTGTGGMSSAEVTQELLSRLAERDPRLAMLATQVMRTRAAAAEADSSDSPQESLSSDADAERSERSNEIRTRLRERIASMSAELTMLRERSEVLAQALGACARCWGADELCRFCRGSGEPGTYMPDLGLFEQLVLPAIRCLRRRQARSIRERSHRPSSPNGRDSISATQETGGPR